MKYGYKKMHAKSSIKYLKLIAIFMIIAFASLSAIFSSIIVSTDMTAFAVDAQQKTDLGTDGLAVGTNIVRASTADFAHVFAAGSKNHYKEKDKSQARVLSISSNSSSMGFFYPGETSAGVSFTSKIRPSDDLRKYINDPALKVTARAYVDIRAQDYVSHDADSSDFCNISLIWYPNNNTSSTGSSALKVSAPGGVNRDVALGSLDTFELLPSGMNADAFLELKFDGFGANALITHKEGGLWGIGETTVYDSGVGLKIENIRIEVAVQLVHPVSMNPTTSYEIIGDALRMPDCEYIKAGDQIIVNSNVRTSGAAASNASLENIREIYNIPSSEGVIAWKEGKPAGVTTAPDVHGFFAQPAASYLIRQNVPGSSGNNAAYNNGTTAAFTVRQGTPTGEEALIMSYLPIQAYGSVYSGQLKFKIDNALPNEPILNTTSSFMQTVNNNRYFNDKLVFETGETFFDASALEQQGGAKEYIYYTTNGQDPLPGTDYTHLLRGYNEYGQVIYNSLDFSHLANDMPQDNVPLKLRTFDGAGNRSAVVPYTVRFDTTDYMVSTSFGLGDYLAYTSAATVNPFARLQFSSSYTAQGEPVFAPSGSTNLDNYTYKRDDKVTIRIEQNASQYENYKINYIIGADFAAANYNITMTQVGNVYRYDLVFYMSNTTIRNIRFYFRKKAAITARTVIREYTGNAQTVTNVSVNAYNQNNALEPDGNVKYTIKVKQTGEPSSAYSEEGFVNAGIYNYICEIDSNKYFGFIEGTYTINKISPDVRGVTVSNLIYGASMSDAIISSILEDNSMSTDTSFGGVKGVFSIESPDQFSQLYQLPNVGRHTILVKFTPEPAPSGVPYNPRYNYGKCALNYSEQLIYVDLNVLHQAVSVHFDEETFNKVFNGEPQSIVAYSSTIDPQPLAIEYKLVGQSDSYYSLQAPNNAGVYEVRATIQEHQSNYKGATTTEGTDLKLVIDKRDIDVVIGRGGVQVEGLEAIYGHFVKPSQTSGLKAGLYLDELDIFDEGEEEIVPVLFDYEYSIAGGNNFIPLPTQYQLLDAGNYDLKITVNNNNNRGSVTYPLIIRKGTDTYGSSGSNFKINFPGLLYDVNGHIVYGQRLSEISLTPGTNYRATYARYDNTVVVPGRFEVYEDLGNPVLNAGTYPEMQLQFIPNDLINYDIVAVTVQIIIGKATPDFIGVSMMSITYGEEVGLSEHIGQPMYTRDGIRTEVAGTLTIVAPDVKPSAGDMRILHTFEPEDTDNFNEVSNLYIPLTIEKAQATIEFAEPAGRDAYGNILSEEITDIRIYGKNFSSPSVTTSPEGKNVEFIYTYQGQVVNITAQSPIGTYYITANIKDDNYQGTATNALKIVPAEVELAISPINSLLRYGMSLSEITLTGGSCSDGVRTVTGVFSFKYPDAIVDTVGETIFPVLFVPDFELYGYNYNSAELELTIDVQKAVVQVNVDEDSLITSYNEEMQAPVATAFAPNNQALNLAYTFVKDNIVYQDAVQDAGSYQVTIAVNDEFYTGSIIKTFVIEKAEARIIVEDRAAHYTGESIIVNVTTDKDKPNTALVINQSFRSYRNVTSSSMLEVGLYTASLTIVDNNYYGQEQIQFTVKEASYNFEGLEQVYNSVASATFSTVPARLSYTLLYKKAGDSDGTYSTVVPLIAGAYKVRAVFDQEGYTGFYEQDFVIAKAEGVIVCDSEITGEYIDRARTMPASTSPSGLGLVYEYALIEGGEVVGEYTSAQPLSVGTYSVRISINDTNYRGMRDDVVYSITPASLETIFHPIIPKIIVDPDNPENSELINIYYKDSNSALRFDGGRIVFIPNVSNPTSQIIHDSASGLIGGEYSFDKVGNVVEDISALDAGEHLLRYIFTPISSNFKPVYGTFELTIQKKDIKDKIRFIQEDLRQAYNAANLSVRAYIDDEMIASEIDSIDILYNGSRLAPSNVGSYILVATVVAANYQGTITTSGTDNFIIGKAVPSIVEPNLKPIYVGQKLSDSSITLGYAHIAGTDLRIPGTFDFANRNLVMDKANMRNVDLLFTPDASHNFQYTTFTMQIKVIGQEPTLVSKQASAITYGAKLSESALNVNYNVPGSVVWVQPDYIPKVGDRVGYRFVPVDFDNYNIVEDYIDITVHKADMVAENVVGIAFVGYTFNSVDIKGEYTNIGYPYAKVDGTLQLISVQGYNVTDTINSNLQNIQGRVRFTSPNYNTIEFDITINTYYLINNNIEIAKVTKTYDGSPLVAADFGIQVSGTNHSIYPDQFSFVYKRDGIVIDNADTAAVGRYTIEIKINDSVYYGVKQFTFSVNKINLSDAIRIDWQESNRTFGSIISPNVFLEESSGLTLDPSQYQVLYRAKGTTQFGTTLPLGAGIYDVRVVIDCPIYDGSKTFEFNIEKATIDVFCDNMTQNYGEVVAPLPTFGANIGGNDYTITYDGSLIMPVDAGSYRAIIKVNHRNYQGSREIAFDIIQATVEISQMPTLSDIKYGQGLVDIVIAGGKAVYNQITEIPGIFRVIGVTSSSGNLVVGEYNVVEVEFSPVNANYAKNRFSMPLTVRKAQASIDFRNLELEYNTLAQSPQFIITPDKGIKANVTYYSSNAAGMRVLLPSAPVNAGTYIIEVSINDNNYEGCRESVFIIKKARAKEVINPTVSDLVYMEAVKNARFSGGRIVYIAEYGPAEGTYKFAREGTILGNAGRSYSVPFIFQPLDSANYDIYEGVIEVNVIKKEAIITVSGNAITYGNTLASLNIKTSPAGLNVAHDIPDLNTFYDAGSYTYTAVINDQNYKGRLKFSVTIAKKEVNFIFYKNNNRESVVANGYETIYNQQLYAQAYIQGLINKDLAREVSINNQIIYEYFSKDKKVNYGHIPPKNAGEYVVVARLSHNNYSASESSASMPYHIGRATVNDIIFDTRSLNSQVYGDVAAPVVTTSPHDVRLQISYVGYSQMPKSAGFYTIKAEAVDPNYLHKEKSATFKILPRVINITNIKVQDKVYNNTANLVITGELTGVLIGDQVSVELTARCANGNSGVGYHDVEILSYTLINMHAGNYIVNPPVYTKQVRITDNKIEDETSKAYMTSSKGFSENVMIKVTTVDSVNNKGGLLAALTGQEGTVQSFTIMEGDQELPLTEMVKVYIKIPDKYLKAENLDFIPLGNLAYANVKFDREGDYVTFYTNTTGEIMFINTKAPTSAILFLSSGVLLVLGLLMVFITNPVRKRKKVTAERYRYMR